MGMTAEERADQLCDQIATAGGYDEMDVGVAEKLIAAAIKSAEREAHNAALEQAMAKLTHLSEAYCIVLALKLPTPEEMA